MVVGGSAAHYYQMGLESARSGDLAGSERLFLAAIALAPSIPAYRNDLGVTLLSLGRCRDAVREYHRALGLDPVSWQIQNNLANALLQDGDIEAADVWCRRALQGSPRFGAAHNTMGCVLLESGLVEEAVLEFRRALECPNPSPEVCENLGRALLTMGEYEQGWEYLGVGRKDRNGVEGEVWEGSSLRGGTILIAGEGGMGNVIHFARYLQQVSHRGGRVILGCQRTLAGLLKSARGVDDVISPGDKLPAGLKHITSLMNLPRVFATRADTIPHDVPYIFADPHLLQRWQTVFESRHKFTIGVVWQGEQSTDYGRKRSIPLAHFGTLSDVPGVELVSLQKGWDRTAGFALTRFPELDTSSGPFMDTAAVMKSIDLIITADTSAAHLAGALGVPVWVALPFAPDWRWMLHREDSPWYPTMRLFRQTERGKWRDVFERMAKELTRLVNDKCKTRTG